AHRRRNRNAHRAEPAGVDPGVRVLVADELRGPHLVLADAGHKDRLRTGDLADPVDDVLRVERAVRLGLVAEWIRTTPAVALCPPRGVVRPMTGIELGLNRHDEVSDDLAGITHDWDVGDAVLRDLGRVDVGMDDGRARG